MAPSPKERARKRPDDPLLRAILRRLLPALLRTDADLDAFCLDYFQEVYDRFSRGMDRVEKLNLLLEWADSAHVLERLREKFRGDLSASAVIEHVLAQPRSDDEQADLRQHEFLERLYIHREQLIQDGKNTQVVDSEIVAIKRAQRRASLLSEGELLRDQYRLIEIIGRGGFATVWKAFDRKSHRLVAVKVLHLGQGDEPHRVDRFERGARQMGKLDHPHIMRVIDGPDEHKEFHYYVMDYLPKGDLSRALIAGQIDSNGAIKAILQAGEALAFMHQRGLIHRDVKPQNILLDEQGSARLTDFDLIWAPDTTGGTRTGAMGTFLFSAPEAMEDASRVDPRADVYSLGMCALFAYHRRSLTRKVLDDRAAFIKSLNCPSEVKDLLVRSTASEPRERPSTVQDFCRELRTALPQSDKNSPPSGDAKRTKNWLMLAVGGGLSIGALIAWRSPIAAGESPPRAVPVVATPQPQNVPKPAIFSIKSTPSGAAIIRKRDGEVLGTTPFELSVLPSALPLEVELRLDDYQPRLILLSAEQNSHEAVIQLNPLGSIAELVAPINNGAEPDGCLSDRDCFELYRQARDAYEKARYKLALIQFNAAYKTQPVPWLLVNIGRTLGRLDRKSEALEYYRRYQKSPHPDPEIKALVDTLLPAKEPSGRAVVDRLMRDTDKNPKDHRAFNPSTP